MKIIADEKIPLLTHYFGAGNELILKEGRTLTREAIGDADALIIRSVTKIDQALLQGTRVQFVGSVTSGADHLDTAWLEKAGIRYFVAEGCNSVAVVEYVVAVIASLQKNNRLTQPKPRAGVIGVGKIGKRVVDILQAFDFEVFQCDPLRARNEKDFSHTPIEALEHLDFVSLHTPLTNEGPFPTFHLINGPFLQRQKNQCVILSAGRGAVVDSKALLTQREKIISCLDVWENEPAIDLALLKEAYIATPHIAGHSIQSKYRAIQMVYESAQAQGMVSIASPVEFPQKRLSFHGQKTDWRDIVLAVYAPADTTLIMKKNLPERGPTEFDRLRNQYNKDEFQFVQITDVLTDKILLKKLGFGLDAERFPNASH